MELMGIADEASSSIDGQIRATKELGWKWIEARFAEVDGFCLAGIVAAEGFSGKPDTGLRSRPAF